MSLPDNFLPRATQLLLPRLSTPDEREAWLAQAFFLNDPRLYHDLRQMSGVPIVYVTRCITALLTAKCIPGRDVHSLALLLNAVRIGSAPSEQREIDTLVDLLDPMCGPGVEPPITHPIDTPPVKPNTPLQTIDTPVGERTPTVFISYAHADDEFAHKLIDDLQNAGHAIWIDTVSIKGGDAWVRSIADGIRNSYAFLTLITPDANLSRWVLREYLLAENLKKPIYPVLAKQADIPIQMIDRQAVMLHEDYADGLRDLLETLPSPSIPVPAIEDVIVVPPPAPSVSRPPKPITRPSPAPLPQESPAPQNAPPAKSSSRGGDVPGGIIGGLMDILTGRSRDREELPPEPQPDKEKKREERPQLDQESESLPNRSQVSEAEEADALASQYPASPAVKADFDEGSTDDIAAPAPSRRALELQYVQRQWAEAFSAQQDAPESNDDMIVRWMPLPADARLDNAANVLESGHVTRVGAGLQAMRRAVVMGDSPREVTESVWSAQDMLMQAALADPTQPLPVVVDLAKWTDAAQSLDAFVQGELGELGGYWQALVAQKRAALLFIGFESSNERRSAAVEAFLRAHPELSVLVAKVQSA